MSCVNESCHVWISDATCEWVMSYMRRDVFTCCITVYETWRVHSYDPHIQSSRRRDVFTHIQSSHSHVTWHDSFTRDMTWLIHTWHDMTHSQLKVRAWLDWAIWDVTRSHVVSHVVSLYMRRDLFTCLYTVYETWRVHSSPMLHRCIWDVTCSLIYNKVQKGSKFFV